MRKLFTHPVVFVVLYLLFMLPTYVLPYLGSNSSLLNTAAVASDTMNPAFLAHAFFLLVLVALTWFRGAAVGKRWLIIFPVLATVFDLMPVLNFIPLVATTMHILAMILGVVGQTKATEPQPA